MVILAEAGHENKVNWPYILLFNSTFPKSTQKQQGVVTAFLGASASVLVRAQTERAMQGPEASATPSGCYQVPQRGQPQVIDEEILSLEKMSSHFFFFLGPHPWHMEVSSLGGPIRAVATSIPHSHSNTRSEPGLKPAPQLTATPG